MIESELKSARRELIYIGLGISRVCSCHGSLGPVQSHIVDAGLYAAKKVAESSSNAIEHAVVHFW